jgi:F0F1-type ATP synthase membrane subunit a
MSRKKRVVITFFVVEALLGVLWMWLSAKRSVQGSPPGGIQVQTDAATADALQVIGSTMGMAMGALAGFFVLLFLIAAKNDRENPKG